MPLRTPPVTVGSNPGIGGDVRVNPIKQNERDSNRGDEFFQGRLL